MSYARFFRAAALSILAVAASPNPTLAGPISAFAQTNLVSSITGMAPVIDTDLRNPWGVSFTSTSPFWVSDQVTGVATLYNSTGAKQALTVPMPGSPAQSPTGTISNSSSSFHSDLFLFATLNGTITGWRNPLTTAEVLFSATDAASYTGLTSATVGGTPLLYAADNANGKIDVFNNTGKTTLAGSFTDPMIPSGFAPYNVQNINGSIYVTYASDSSSGGFVSVFNLDGTFVKRLVSNGVLDSPWGIVLAPSTFGTLGNDFLIGNEDDGMINAFDSNGNLIGTLAAQNGNPLVNDGLWTLTFGNGGNGGNPNSLYITAGINNEQDGLFARIDAVPEPGTFGLLALAGCAALMWKAPRLRRR